MSTDLDYMRNGAYYFERHMHKFINSVESIPLFLLSINGKEKL